MVHIGYLPGRPVLGFWGLKEADYGCPDTPAPYDRVVIPRSGIFPCPHCARQINFSDPRRREHYRDARVVEVPLARGRAWVQRNNYWCPWCGWRFYLAKQGDEVGRVERYAVQGGRRTLVGCVEIGLGFYLFPCIRKHYLRGLDVLRGRG